MRKSIDWEQVIKAIKDLTGALLSNPAVDDLLERIVYRRMAVEFFSGPDVNELFKRIIQKAVDIIPYAQAGSLIVREPDGTFVYKAAVGFDFEILRHVRLRKGAMVAIKEPQIYIRVFESGLAKAGKADIGEDNIRRFLQVGSHNIKCTLSAPLWVGNRFFGSINVDNFTREDAFNSDDAYVLSLFADQAALTIQYATQVKTIERLANEDYLTECLNRRGLFTELRNRNPKRFVVYMLDVRGLKRINDTKGHEEGDKLLKFVASTIKKIWEGKDALVGRWGGDEFVVVAENVRDPQEFARRMEERLEGKVDVGYAVVPDEAPNFEAALRVADTRMYVRREKRRCRLYPG